MGPVSGSDDALIWADGLTKRFGDTTALEDFDLRVPEGKVVALLGPNGSGKTTLVKILATLLRPDEGRARVYGHDVVGEPHEVRASIGLTGQYAAIDESLTGAENLALIGWLLGMDRKEGRRRAHELLERFDLADAGDRAVREYSGGMSRRLDLAASLVGEPPILFLDEPTTGLDPRSRRSLWDLIRELVDRGATLLLTTQYLDEADALADSIAVIDHGRLIAEGTSDELKHRSGQTALLLRPADRGDVDRAVSAVADLDGRRSDDGEAALVPVGDDLAVMAAAVRRVDDAGILLADMTMRRPSLDDVFLSLTGQRPEGDDSDDRTDDQREAA